MWRAYVTCDSLCMYVLTFKVRNHSTSSSLIQPLLECMLYRCLIKEALRKILSIVLVRMCNHVYGWVASLAWHRVYWQSKSRIASLYVRSLSAIKNKKQNLMNKQKRSQRNIDKKVSFVKLIFLLSAFSFRSDLQRVSYCN